MSCKSLCGQTADRWEATGIRGPLGAFYSIYKETYCHWESVCSAGSCFFGVIPVLAGMLLVLLALVRLACVLWRVLLCLRSPYRIAQE